MRKAKLGVFLFFFAFLAGILAAQDTLQTGNISGTVIDAEGNALPGVTITITSAALLKGTASTTTSPTGAFRFSFLSPGSYEMTFTLSGFKTVKKTGVEISIRKTTSMRVTMEVSALEETVTVIGESPVVDIKTSTIQTNFTQAMLQKLPSARDPWVIMEMTPGVVMDRQNVGGSTSGSQSSAYAHGTMRNQTSYNIDGVNMTDAAANGATAMYFDFDSFEEIQIETGAHTADIQVGGLVLNMITKSGGNKFSGGISLYGENDKLQSANIPDKTKNPQYANSGSGNPLDYYYEWGGDFGGPIIKDKLWFYGAFRNTVINRFIIGYTLNGVPQTEYASLTHGTLKLSFQLTNNNKLMGWFNYDNKYMPHRAASITRPPVTTALQDSPSYFYHLEDTWTLGSNLILNFKFGFNNMWYQTSNQPEVDMNQPAIRIYYTTPVTGGYENAYYNYTWYYSDRYQFNAFADYFKDDFLGGNHEIKVGFEYQNSPFHTTRKHPGNILLYFDNPDHTGAYQVWTFRQEVWNQTDEVYSAYFHDVFSLKKNLTINLGLRLDSTHMHVNATDVASSPWTEYYYASRSTATPIYHQAEQKNVVSFTLLSPRIGLTYDLFNDGKNILKAHYARYSYQVSYGPVDQGITTGYWEVDYNWTDTNGDKLPQTSEFGKIVYTNIGQAVKINPDLKSPYTNEVVAGFEKKLARDMGLSLNFIYRDTQRFWWSDNQAVDPQLDYTPVNVQDPGPDGILGTSDDGGTITIYNLASAKVGVSQPYVKQRPGYMTSYRGVELTLNKRYADKWQFMGSVTLGKTNVKLPIEAVDDPNNRVFNDNVVDSNDAPVIIKASGSYDLPWGFYVGAFFNYRSGYPTTRYFNTSTSLLYQGRISVTTGKIGTSRYPDIAILDLRLSKVFNFGTIGKIELMLDGFNILNSVTTLGWNAQSSGTYHFITQVLSPRIVRLGIKWGF
ncbi:MAG: TonB-dependent receptor [Candidatus Aminicenantes bacterium]|nr:TonB-dependent receptor [Candidatus Aminicenantes bacterium]